MKRDTIIFDLDGTLLNTLDDLADSTNYALKYFDYTQRTIDEVRNFVGNGVAKLIERAIPNGKDNPNFEKCLKIFKENYAKNMYNKTAPYEGIIEMLMDLRIDCAAGENESAGIRKKPAPDTVLKSVRDLNSSVERSIYVGDSDVDIMTAKNSGMPCISVTWGFRDRKFLIEHGAEIFVDNPQEIIEYLESSANS